MELAVAAFGKILGTLGIGAGASAAAAGTAGAAAAGASGLQTLTTVLSVLGTIGAGVSAASGSRDQADQADLQAGQEQVQAAQRQTQMKRTLMQVLGENDVNFAAAGIDISSGIAQSARGDNTKRAASEISIDRRDSDFQSALYRLRANGFRRQAGSQIGGALIGALGKVADLGLSTYQRGAA